MFCELKKLEYRFFVFIEIGKKEFWYLESIFNLRFEDFYVGFCYGYFGRYKLFLRIVLKDVIFMFFEKENSVVKFLVNFESLIFNFCV